MIPQKLKLNNFMSYGENLDVLDFTKIDLACLVGLNGVGKSTILEAIAWSLWGKSRAKSDDDLIRQGANEAWVDFIFSLNNEEYRVIRKKSKSGKGQSNLEFYKRGDNASKEVDWISISGGTKAETQDFIIATLKMTYDTFINSAFIRQGRADEFTIKKPNERKKVLAQILNLHYYDKLVLAVKDIARNLFVEQESLNKKIEFIESEIKIKENLDDEARTMKKDLDKIENQINELDQKLNILNHGKELQDKKIDEASNLDERTKNISLDLEKINTDITENYDNIERDKKFLINEEEIIKSYKKLQQLKKVNEDMENLLKIKSKIDFEKNDTEKNILNKKSEILQRKGNLEYRLGAIERDLTNYSQYQAQLKEIKQDLELINKIAEKKLRAENILKTLIDDLHEFKSNFSQLESRGKELKQKIIELDSVQGSDCPLCGQLLSDIHKKNVIKDLLNKKNQVAIKYVKTRTIIAKLEAKQKDIITKIEDYKNKTEPKARLEGQIMVLNDKIAELKKYQAEKDNILIALKDIQQKLDTGTYDKGNHHKLEEIDRRLKKLNYNEPKHEEIKKEIINLSVYEEQKNKLENIKSGIKQQEIYLNKLIKNRIEKEKELLRNKTRRNKIKMDYEKLEKIENKIIEINKRLVDLRKEMNARQGESGALNEKIHRVKKMEKELKENKKSQSEKLQEKIIADELVKAFGKNGIQAMIIEAAVPEIEADTNRLLDKMTDGKMRVQLKTKKEKKTDGDLIDTLDIIIEDEYGTRNYEMFSGGEAYRINFAIRIALSRLLANRTGARLQFLVIDEGFGTQDMMGRENLIQAINSIADDFKKIIVVTHIQDLKDAFPSRIEVYKDNNGSNYQVFS